MPASRWCLDFVNIFRENFFFVLEKEFQILTHSFQVHPFSSPCLEEGYIGNEWVNNESLKILYYPGFKTSYEKKNYRIEGKVFSIFFAEILYLRWPIKKFYGIIFLVAQIFNERKVVFCLIWKLSSVVSCYLFWIILWWESKLHTKLSPNYYSVPNLYGPVR